MKSSAEREAEFMADLRELLRRHGAEINVEDRSRGYYSEGIACVEMDSIWNGDECFAECAAFDLPRWINGKESK